MVNEIFKYQKPNITKLINYGFKKVGNTYKYETSILNAQFKFFVSVQNNNQVSTKVIDSETGDEYILHLLDNCTGEFVGKVRAEFEKVLLDIKEKCFEKEIFKTNQAKQVIEYIKTKYKDDLEFLWKKFPTIAVWRRKDTKKWYGAILILSKRKLGLDSDENIEVVILHNKPENIQKLIDNKTIFEGYHFNKKYWFTVCLNGTIRNNVLFNYINTSYELAKK